jgi:tetratricopeptide (TPR) repeat protein
MKLPRWIRLTIFAVVAAAVSSGCSRSAQSYLERGNAQMEKENADAAVLAYRNAVQKDPMLAPACVKVVEAYIRHGNGPGALGEAVRAAGLLPNAADAQLRAGELLFAGGRRQDALGRADRALAIDPKKADALVLRAIALAGTSGLDAAIEEMREAIALEPLAGSQANLGYFLAAKGQPKEAEAAYRQAIAIDAESV